MLSYHKCYVNSECDEFIDLCGKISLLSPKSFTHRFYNGSQVLCIFFLYYLRKLCFHNYYLILLLRIYVLYSLVFFGLKSKLYIDMGTTVGDISRIDVCTNNGFDNFTPEFITKTLH